MKALQLSILIGTALLLARPMLSEARTGVSLVKALTSEVSRLPSLESLPSSQPEAPQHLLIEFYPNRALTVRGEASGSLLRACVFLLVFLPMGTAASYPSIPFFEYPIEVI